MVRIIVVFVILTFISGIGDLEFSVSAYIFALLSVVCQSFYLTYIQKTGVEKGLSTLTVLHTNCINCIPLLLIYTVCSKELLSAFRFGGYIDPSFQVCWKCCHFKFYFICMALQLKVEYAARYLSILTLINRWKSSKLCI